MLDVDNAGKVNTQSIIRRFNATRHPDVISGKKPAGEVTREFITCFDVGYESDGCVTLAEFINYYSNVSCLVSDDATFETLAKHIWIPGAPRKPSGSSKAQTTSNGFVDRLRDLSREEIAASELLGEEIAEPEFGSRVRREIAPEISLPDGTRE
jgi:hypothetical protein